jgi:hypothetical protein
MALGEVQAALARLFVDDAARANFFKDPLSAGRTLGLDEDDAARLTKIAPQAIRQFARSLRGKRMLDLRKAAPLTAEALGQSFAHHFRAAATPLREGATQVEEAYALAARLAELTKTDPALPRWIGDLARFEAAFLKAAARPFVLRVMAFRYPVASIAAALRRGALVGDPARRTTFGVWARRRGGRLFHLTWPRSL